ncbi:hypothetical protein H8E52_02175 [bacterium]|nr:hypothetical protein [bacterium]
MFKKVIVVAAMMLFAGVANADVIGVFADDQGGACTTTIMPYVPVDIFIVAILTETFDGGITAAEFKIDNWVGNPGYPIGITAMSYTSDLIIGAIDDDFSIAWNAPQGAGNGIVLIGSANLTMFDAAWIGPDHMMTVAAGNSCACLVTVDDIFEIHNAQGGLFWFNCSVPEDCVCLLETATEETSWSSVKALF